MVLTFIFDKLRTRVAISVATSKRVHNFQTRRGENVMLKINNITDKKKKYENAYLSFISRE